MKDIITFLILLILCILIEDVDTNYVFDELENQDIVKVYNLEIENLDTNNFLEVVKGLDVITIRPYINPVYEDKILKVFMYEDINTFKKTYINYLKQKGFYNEANKHILRPIILERISVNASLNEIYDVLENKEYKIINK